MQKSLKIWSLLVCLSVVVAFKTTKVYITSCIITCDSGPYCSNFITCIRIYDAKKKNHDHAKYWFKKLPSEDLPTDLRRTKANKFQTKRPISLKLPPARPKSVYLPVRRAPVYLNSAVWARGALHFASILVSFASPRCVIWLLSYEIRILEPGDRVRSTNRHSRGGGSLLLPYGRCRFAIGQK